MIEQRAGAKMRQRLLRVALCALALLLFTATSSIAATPAPRLNGAGLVIKHGDGSVLYFYVQFGEPQITGEQLLERAGVQLDITPYAGIGTGVCMIDHEGCPSSNCFCKSFAVPSVYWRYHSLNADGKWVYRASGPTQRIVHDGDVDGWSWSSEDGDLPATSIDAIAKLNGITRSPANGTQVATPAPSPAALDTVATPAATAVPSSAVSTTTPRVAGVAVSENGNTTPVDPSATGENGSSRAYVWFGAGVVVLLLIAVALALRRRAGAAR
ncbi:MAG TPA: hypothetical protein VF201_10515 [Nitrolancea sp.]